jgi:hypothetical protein
MSGFSDMGKQEPHWSNSLSHCHIEQSEKSAVALRNFRARGDATGMSENDRSPTEGAGAFRPLDASLQ